MDTKLGAGTRRKPDADARRRGTSRRRAQHDKPLASRGEPRQSRSKRTADLTRKYASRYW
jgi:hypothetical protein